MNSFGSIATALPSIAIVVLCIWIYLKHGVRKASGRRAGTYAVMWALYWGFGRFFDGNPEYVEVARDPEWKKRAENGDPPET